jgi:serine/threonine-protein kinase
VPAATAPAATAPATTPAAPPLPSAPPSPPPVAPPTATADANTAPGNAGASVADLVGPQPSGNAAHPTDNPVAAANTANASGAAAANDAAPAPAPRASQVEPLRDLPAAQAAQASPPPAKPRIASVTPPPPVSAPPRPHVPTVAVFAVGDEIVAEPAEQAIEEALSRKGYHLVDQSMMPRAERMLRGQRANVAAILEQLAQRHGGIVDAVIIVHARPAGEQQITFYGQSDTLKTAQLNINAYAVDGRRKLGAGWSDNVNFTAMSARDKAQEAVEPMLEEIEASLREFRPSGRKG